MSQEIERKFLLDALPVEAREAPAEPIRQGYVCVDDRAEVRVRARGDRYILTIKGGTGLARAEEELDLTAERFAALWPLTEGRRVEKVRHRVALAEGLVAEIDVYSGALAGLVTAEVEFASVAASEAFTPPPWLGAEVTGDARYANRTLAVAGVPAR